VNIGKEPLGNYLVLRPHGRIDSSTSPEFTEELLQSAAGSTSGVIVDFAGVEYISSAGLRALMTAIRQRKDRRVAVAGLLPVIHEIFRIARFQHVVAIFDTVDAAARAWSSDPAPDLQPSGGPA